jgi:hypothetical protein
MRAHIARGCVMRDPAPVVDASVFLGMHHHDLVIRERSLAFFAAHLTERVWMSFEQIGVCDSAIWRESRSVQELYYPFMDRLQIDMPIDRGGASQRELALAIRHSELSRLRPERALVAAQVLARGAVLVSHDPVLRGLRCLRSHLWDFEGDSNRFPSGLQALYEKSRAFVYARE